MLCIRTTAQKGSRSLQGCTEDPVQSLVAERLGRSHQACRRYDSAEEKRSVTSPKRVTQKLIQVDGRKVKKNQRGSQRDRGHRDRVTESHGTTWATSAPSATTTAQAELSPAAEMASSTSRGVHGCLDRVYIGFRVFF